MVSSLLVRVVAFVFVVAATRKLLQQARAFWLYGRWPAHGNWQRFLPALGPTVLMAQNRDHLVELTLQRVEDLNVDVNVARREGKEDEESLRAREKLCGWGWSAVHNFGEPNVMLVHPECVKHHLDTAFHRYEKGSILAVALAELLGDGIFNTDGARWKPQRQVAAHLFKGARMSTFFVEVFNNHIDPVVRILDQAAKEGKPVDVQDLMMRFTLDSIGALALGRNIGSLEKDVPFSRAFAAAQTYSERRLVAIPGSFLFNEPRLKRALADLDRFAYTVVDERLRARDAGQLEHLRTPAGLKEADLLSRYVMTKDKDGKDFDRKFLRDSVLNFMIAGRDTTGVTISWALYLLSQNPAVVDRARREVADIIARRSGGGTHAATSEANSSPSAAAAATQGDDGRGGDPDDVDDEEDDGDAQEVGGESPVEGIPTLTYRELKTCKYLIAIVKETTRLFPPVPTELKQAVEDDVLPCGMKVHKGTLTLWSAYIMGRYSGFWEDAERFDPDRWIRGDPCLRHPYQWLPFQGGPRRCLGERLAIMEVCFVLAAILPRYTFTHDDKTHEVVQHHALLLSSEGGMPLTPARV